MFKLLRSFYDASVTITYEEHKTCRRNKTFGKRQQSEITAARATCGFRVNGGPDSAPQTPSEKPIFCYCTRK